MATELDLYSKLIGHLARPYQLSEYPKKDPNDPKSMQPTSGLSPKPLLQLTERTCVRCKRRYKLRSDGFPLATTDVCQSHFRKTYFNGFNTIWACCRRVESDPGCYLNQFHVNEGEDVIENYTGFVETKALPVDVPIMKNLVFALDCEMCVTTVGMELIRVSVINYKYDLVYDKLVKPLRPIIDYNTKWSGITEANLVGVTTTLEDVQRDLLELFSDKTILVGHALNHDMKALKIFHERFVDTAILYSTVKGRTPSLKKLMQDVFGESIQASRSHDSGEDAKAALRLVIRKIQ